MPFIPHTEKDIQAMLSTIGVTEIDNLFDEIPLDLRTKTLKDIPPALTELQLSQLMRQRAEQDKRSLCFIGAGAYEHHIPAAVWEIASRGEFMTAYTPYQAEASQGTLQLLYEYQTMMASLMSLDVSNASLYDGATALAEAVLMATRLGRHQSRRILVPKTVHPHYREVIKTIIKQQNIEVIEIPYDVKTGQISMPDLIPFTKERFTALVIPQPNFFGVLENVDELTDWAHTHHAMVIAVVNPLAMGLLKPPGKWGQKGADIACGEGQPLGVPLASGGPYYGFLCCKKPYVRQLPGRIVGRTRDIDGKQGFVLTLQTREQHIRRSKATSNICTNQGLLVTASTIYMSLLGPAGLRATALVCHQHLLLLQKKLAQCQHVKKVYFMSPCFNEIVLQFDQAVESVLYQLAKNNIQLGYSLKHYYPELGESVLMCTTDIHTADDITLLVDKINQAVTEKKVCPT